MHSGTGWGARRLGREGLLEAWPPGGEREDLGDGPAGLGRARKPARAESGCLGGSGRRPGGRDGGEGARPSSGSRQEGPSPTDARVGAERTGRGRAGKDGAEEGREGAAVGRGHGRARPPYLSGAGHVEGPEPRPPQPQPQGLPPGRPGTLKAGASAAPQRPPAGGRGLAHFRRPGHALPVARRLAPRGRHVGCGPAARPR